MPASPFRLLALSLVLGGAVAQSPNEPSPEPAATPTASLLAALKSRSLPLEDAYNHVDELVTRDVDARLAAARALQQQLEIRQRGFDKQSRKVMARVAGAARKAQKQHLGRKGAKEVDQLRADALAISRRSELTKDEIKSKVDPNMTRLGEWLLPERAQLFASDARLAAKVDALRLANLDLGEWFALYRTVLTGLDGNEDVDRFLAKNPSPTAPGDDQAFDRALAFATFAGLAMAAGDRKALEANAALRDVVPHEEYLGTLELNRLRYLLGLSLVRIDPKLADAARDHSKDMHELNFFSHTSPVDGKESFGKRASNFGTSASAENIAAGQATGHGAIKAWWYSPGHHRNMLGNHHRTGLGQHANKWTQLFGG